MGISSTIVGNFALFQNLNKEALESISLKMRVKYVEKGQYIIATKSDNTDVFFLVSGAVRVCFFAENGKQVHFEQLLPGAMFGELAAIDDKGRSSDCISIEDCQLAILSREDFRSLLSEFEPVLQAVLVRLAEMVRFNMRKVYEFSAFSVSQRVRFELLRLASEASSEKGPIVLSNVPTHAEIAARISTHREAVTRELNALVARGIISWGHSGHAIHDVVALSDNV